MTRFANSHVRVGLASIPSRVALLERSFRSLVDQVSEVGVYLNGYETVPSFLRHRRVVVARSQDHGDVRDNGKFFFLDGCQQRFYAAADDDIEYPANYIARLLQLLSAAPAASAVGVHGALYPSHIHGLVTSRVLQHFAQPSPHVLPVHLLGTGTVLFDQSTWNLQYSEFGDPGMADVWFALAAKRRHASLFVINRDRQWLAPLTDDDGETEPSPGSTLFDEAAVSDRLQASLLAGASVSDGGYAGLVHTLLRSSRFAEDLSISQAVTLNEIRQRLGWQLPQQADLDLFGTLIGESRSHWSRQTDGDGDDDAVPAVHLDAVLSVLGEDVSASTAEKARRLLNRCAALYESDRERWRALPFALRFDSKPSRFRSTIALLDGLAVKRSAEDARQVWPHLSLRGDVTLDAALEVERAGIDTSFQYLPALGRAARRDPLQAAGHLRTFLEERSWSDVPDVWAWRLAFGSRIEAKELQILLAVAALHAGRIPMAARVAATLRQQRPADLDLDLLESMIEACTADFAAAARFAICVKPLDGVLDAFGLRTVGSCVTSHDRVDHWMDLLDGAPSAILAASAPVLSVIMTVHNDALTVGGAIRSVLASESVSLELIVVDDASTDGTCDVVSAIDDPRVRTIQNPDNLGPYVSRNRAIGSARGEFITFADADDWTHPERFVYQLGQLVDHPELVGCTVAHVRFRRDGLVDMENNLLFVGHGPVSLMYRRYVVDQIGGFDHVRTRGDIEFLGRLRARFGESAIAAFEIPLILATSSPSSNSKRFTPDALRRYRGAARKWHSENRLSDDLYVGLDGDRAPFIGPEELVVRHERDDRSKHAV